MSYALLVEDYEQTGRGVRYFEMPLNNLATSVRVAIPIVTQKPQHADYSKSEQFENIFEIIDPDSYTKVRIRSADPNDEVEFSRLAEQWKRETRHSSFVREQITHQAFLQILVMSERALPMLIREI